MLKILLYLFPFLLLTSTLAFHVDEFMFSSSLIPLYMQNQLFDPEATITLPQSRLLAGLDPHIILVSPSYPLVQCTIGNDTQSNFQGLHINIFQ